LHSCFLEKPEFSLFKARNRVDLNVLKIAVEPSAIPGRTSGIVVILGEILKRPTRTDCKSVDLCLHRFESCSPHCACRSLAKESRIKCIRLHKSG
jgi:hypothetical protein